MTFDEQLAFASIREIGKLFRQGKLSPVELIRFLLDRIALLNTQLNAYITVSAEIALQQAKAAERSLCSGKGRKGHRDLGPLHGIPLSLKDNIYTKGLRTTGGSQILREFVPSHDAPVVAALKNAGAVLLGKTNMHEFAYGTTSNNPHYGPVKNPWDSSRIAGGSSGGSAAALAAGLCYGSIGTDTGGSIRIPSSLCGTVGLKAGLGRVSTEGVIPLSTTLDCLGPMARTADEAALLFEVIVEARKSGRGLRAKRASGSRGRKRLGIPKEFFFDVVSTEVRRAFEKAVGILKKAGASLKEVSVPLLPETEDAGNQIAWAEATLYHQDAGWYPHRTSEYGGDVSMRLEMGTKVTAVTYLRALELREKFIEKFHKALEGSEIDALAVPTTPIAAARIDEDSIVIDGKDHATRGLLLRLNRPANLAGVPAISVPCGRTDRDLPVGLQFIGGVNSEATLLDLAADFEQARPADSVRPALTARE